ncbi:MAG: hypothetical protein B2I17_02225 [Thermoplasmatales archaeon B_DKE]|nr:MAG: hypothetical protein B2I17_02225 [Thermoplasmatales archaeon B_DKE]
MKVLILGVDGYIGWSLALRLMKRGHTVAGADNFITRRRVREVGSASALPISSMDVRIKGLETAGYGGMEFFKGDVSNADFMYRTIRAVQPDTVIHLAEQETVKS